MDERIVDVHDSRFSLTDAERTLLQTIVDRNVVDVAEIGRTLGVCDDGVFQLLRTIAEKLDEFRYLVHDRTPPLGIPRARPRRRAALRADTAGS